MPRQERVTIKEIARACGVSTQTVSRVINRRPDVAPATRTAVEAAIAAAGFQPSAVARSLVQRRSQTLGVIVSGLKFFGIAQTLNGITEGSQREDYALLLTELAGFETPDIVPVIEFLATHRVDGIIFAAPQVGTNVQKVQAQLPPGCPPIVFLKSEPSPAFSTIGIDNFDGGRRATEHLIKLGRRRITHLSGPLDWFESRQRRDGWRAGLREAALDAGATREGNWTSASGEAGFEELLEAEPEMDAIFAGNDQMALGILHVAHARGIRVPDDLAVVGFDGLEESAQFTPSLTTVNQPLRELGQLAVRELLTQVTAEAGPADVKNLRLPTELIVRESAPALGAESLASMARSDGREIGSPSIR